MNTDLTKVLLDVAELTVERGASAPEVLQVLKRVQILIQGPHPTVVDKKRSVKPSRKQNKKYKFKDTGRTWTPNCSRTGKVPFGYKRDPSNKSRLILDQRQLELVPAMFDLERRGVPRGAIRDEIASLLRREGITSNIAVATVYRILDKEHPFTR